MYVFSDCLYVLLYPTISDVVHVLPQWWFGFSVFSLCVFTICKWKEEEEEECIPYIEENGINNQVIGLVFLSFAPTNHINSLLTTIFRDDAMLFLTPCLLFLIRIFYRVVLISFFFLYWNKNYLKNLLIEVVKK